jgi:hypothetical protein
MAKFFFDVDDGIAPMRDSDGQRFPDPGTASKEATGLLVDIARDLALQGICNDITVDLRNDTGHVVFTATLSVKARWVNWTKTSAHLAAPQAAALRQRGGTVRLGA